MYSYISAINVLFNRFSQRFNSPTCRWAVAEYKDHEDGGPFVHGWNLIQPFTNDYSRILTWAIPQLQAYGGGDQCEQNLSALKNAADQWFSQLGGRSDPNVHKVIIWGGDNPGHCDGHKDYPYPTLSTVIDKLTAIKGLRVYGLTREDSFYAASLDGKCGGVPGTTIPDCPAGQATAITEATKGKLWYTDFTSLEEMIKVLCKALS